MADIETQQTPMMNNIYKKMLANLWLHPDSAESTAAQQPQQSAMDRFFGMLEKGYNKQQEQSENYLDIAKNTAAERSKWMEMLMAEHRNKQSANPFIALLDGYIGMKKRKNSEYEWRGLATTVPEAIGGLLGRTRSTPGGEQ